MQQEYWFASFDPFLRARLDYEAWEDTSREQPTRWGAVLGDLEFRNLLTHTRWFLDGDVSLLTSALSQLDELMRMLEARRAS